MLFYCDRQKFPLIGGFFIFLFILAGRGIFICSNDNTLYSKCGSIDVKMDGSVLEEKSSFEVLGLNFSSKLDWGSYIISIAKTASKKIGALIRSVKFPSPEVVLYLYKYTI